MLIALGLILALGVDVDLSGIGLKSAGLTLTLAGAGLVRRVPVREETVASRHATGTA